MRRALHEISSNEKSPAERLYHGITLGTVVDIGDKQEQNRLRVSCPGLGDAPYSSPNFVLEDIPWARIVDETGGASVSFESGPNGDLTSGLMGHGTVNQIQMFSTAVIACLDGDPSFRVVLGVISPQLIKNTLPVGRYLITDDGTLDGPFTESGTPVQPLFNNLEQAYDKTSYEWLSRGADFQAAVLSNNIAKALMETASDDKELQITLPDGTTITLNQGYDDNKGTVYSKTTPGMHSFSMDDRAQNCRVRMKTTTGRQVLLDDTNERIFVSTPKNRNWVEMDDNGNFDFFSNTRLSIYGANDVNVSSSGHLRLYGKQGVHILSDVDVRIATPTLNLQTGATAWNNSGTFDVASSTLNVSTDNMNVDTSSFYVSAESYKVLATEALVTATTLSLVGSSEATLSSATTAHVYSPIVNIGGGLIFANSASSPAVPGVEVSPETITLETATYAYSTNRVPFNYNDSLQMWSRSSLDPSVTDNDDQSNVNDFLNYDNMEFDYLDPRSNIVDLGLTYQRNKHWKR